MIYIVHGPQASGKSYFIEHNLNEAFKLIEDPLIDEGNKLPPNLIKKFANTNDDIIIITQSLLQISKKILDQAYYNFYCSCDGQGNYRVDLHSGGKSLDNTLVHSFKYDKIQQ